MSDAVQPTPDPVSDGPGHADGVVRLGLTGHDALPWRPVERGLALARSITLAICMAPVALAGVLGAVLLASWLWWVFAAVLLVWVWAQWLVARQVSAISWVELPEEIAIRRGRLWRTLVTIPYGRIQYVDLQSGPLLRHLGLAGIEVHTASPASSGSIPGLAVAEAEALRDRLAARGEAQRAGL